VKAISDILKGLFTFVLYPLLIIGLFGFIAILIIQIVSEANGLYSRMRRLTGAFLPVVILIFIVLVSDQENEPIKTFLLSIPVAIHLSAGAVAGLATVELGRRLMRLSDDTGPSVYCLFLSSVGVFILYSIMQGILGSLNYFLFGLAVVGGLDVIFRGPPLRNQRTTSFDSDREGKLFKEELLHVKTYVDFLGHEVKNMKSAAVSGVPVSPPSIDLESRIKRLEFDVASMEKALNELHLRERRQLVSPKPSDSPEL